MFDILWWRRANGASQQLEFHEGKDTNISARRTPAQSVKRKRGQKIKKYEIQTWIPDNSTDSRSNEKRIKKMMPYKELNEKQIDKEIKKYGVNRDL